jgi:hypothetical protein
VASSAPPTTAMVERSWPISRVTRVTRERPVDRDYDPDWPADGTRVFVPLRPVSVAWPHPDGSTTRSYALSADAGRFFSAGGVADLQAAIAAGVAAYRAGQSRGDADARSVRQRSSSTSPMMMPSGPRT